MSNKRSRKSNPATIPSDIAPDTDSHGAEEQLRSAIQDIAIVINVVAVETEATVVVSLPEATALLAIPNIEAAIYKIGWKLENWATEGNQTTLSLTGIPESIPGWWDGQNFRGDIPEIVLQDILPFLPDHGRVDLNVLANSTGCTFLHIDKLLTRALDVDAVQGLRHIDRAWWIGTPQVEPPVKAPQEEAPVDPAHLAQVEALKAAIEQLTPEAKAKAVEMGLVAGERRSVKSTDPVGTKKPRPSAKSREQHECACGCGGLTFNAFCMGHDARAKGRLQRAVNGKLMQDEMSWRPNANLIAYVRSHPEWDNKFGTWLSDFESAAQELGGPDEVILDAADDDNDNE